MYVLEENVKALFCLQKLLTAAENGNIKEVELCIKNGASLECRDSVSKVKCLTHLQIFII